MEHPNNCNFLTNYKTTNHETESRIDRQENWQSIRTSFQKQKIMQPIYEQLVHELLIQSIKHFLKQPTMEKNFTNTQFKWTFESISDNIPTIMLTTIVLTYGINAYLTAIFLPIDFWIAIIASSILQLGRFAVVFMDFLNPTKGRSPYPPKIALGATLIALIEIFFGLSEKYSGAEFITMFFFVGTIVVFGYLLEINFVDKGVEAYGINEKKIIKRRRRTVNVKPEPITKENTTFKPFVSSFKTITL